MRKRAKFFRPFMYVFTCRTPRGFQYNGYSNSLENAPITAIPGTARINLKK